VDNQKAAGTASPPIDCGGRASPETGSRIAVSANASHDCQCDASAITWGHLRPRRLHRARWLTPPPRAITVTGRQLRRPPHSASSREASLAVQSQAGRIKPHAHGDQDSALAVIVPAKPGIPHETM
jgi:hypothetical protein